MQQRPQALSLTLERLSAFGLQTVHGPPAAPNAGVGAASASASASSSPAEAAAAAAAAAAARAGAGADVRCTSLSYSDVGDYLVSSHNDGSLRLLDGRLGGGQLAEYNVRESGCRLVTHTHHPLAVLHAASKSGSAAGRVSYHSLQENCIVRTFDGHTDFVTSIAMSPADDAFLTTSRDGSWKLWDLRARGAVAGAPMPTRGLAVAAFDARAKVFAVATPQRMLALYDPRTMAAFATTTEPLMQQTVTPGKYPPGPSGTGVAGAAPPPRAVLEAGAAAADAARRARLAPLPPSIAWTGIEFSPDDRYLALATLDRGVLIVDAYSPGRELALLQYHPYDPQHASNISWSPDGRFLSTGSVDGHVYSYDLSGRPPATPLGSDETAVICASRAARRHRSYCALIRTRPTACPALPAAVPDLPYNPELWAPPACIVGEFYKGDAARAAAHAAAKAYLPAARLQMHEAFKEAAKKADPGEALRFSLPMLPVPEAATPEDSLSRHEGPVRAVRWHPRAAILASASQAVGIWMPATPLVEIDAGALTRAAASAR